MAMEGERKASGQWQVRLGTVEKWVVTAGAGLLTVALGFIFIRVTGQLDTQGKAIQDLATQQAVTNSQLTTLNLQLADVPSITRKLAEHDVRIDRLESDVKELRGTRGLK